MSLPGFTPGEKAQNVVVAAMYLVAIVGIVGVAAASIGMPGSLLSQGGGGGGGNPAATATPAGPAEQTQARSQPENQAEGSGWVTVTSSGDSGNSGGGSTDSAPSTQRINENQIQLTALRNLMENSSRVQLVSADIRQNEMYVRYSQNDMSRSEIVSGVGTVSGGFLGMVASGADLDAIHGRLVDNGGQVAYTWSVDRETVMQYNNGEISDSEYRQQVISSLQPANQSSGTTGSI